MSERIEELHSKRARVEAGGGEKRHAKQHEQGKLTARERIEKLVDAGSFDEREASARARPASVRRTPRPDRSISDTPARRCSVRSCCEAALGVRPVTRAACVTVPWSARARRISNCVISMKQTYNVPKEGCCCASWYGLVTMVA